MYTAFGKRILDLLFSLTGFTILLPFFILISICLLFVNNGKVFFIQSRPGKNGVLFNIIKFKTMNDKTDREGKLLPNVQRITPFGSFIRKTSLDEIPQLINVIKGNMSLIGPRPLLPEYLNLYNDFEYRRHEVKPGITGWAQVNGRNTISWQKKFEYDVWYVDHINIALDMKILWLTIIKVIKSDDISASPHITMERFKGSL